MKSLAIDEMTNHGIAKAISYLWTQNINYMRLLSTGGSRHCLIQSGYPLW